MRKTIFKVINPKDGKEWEIFDDGSATGFPDGSVLINKHTLILIRQQNKTRENLCQALNIPTDCTLP